MAAWKIVITASAETWETAQRLVVSLLKEFERAKSFKEAIHSGFWWRRRYGKRVTGANSSRPLAGLRS